MIAAKDRVRFVKNTLAPRMWDRLVGHVGVVASVHDTEGTAAMFPYVVDFGCGEMWGCFESELERLNAEEG